LKEKYVGLDVHQSSTMAAVHDEKGKVMMESILKWVLLYPHWKTLTHSGPDRRDKPLDELVLTHRATGLAQTRHHAAGEIFDVLQNPGNGLREYKPNQGMPVIRH